MVRSAVTDAYFPKKKPSVHPCTGIKMSAPEEGGQDHDDILGFLEGGFQDPEDGDLPRPWKRIFTVVPHQ